LKPNAVVLLRDGDDAGREGAIKEARELAYAMINVEIAQLPEGKDPDSATRDEVREALDNARPIELDFGIESQKEVHQ
jgi:DNA primase